MRSLHRVINDVPDGAVGGGKDQGSPKASWSTSSGVTRASGSGGVSNFGLRLTLNSLRLGVSCGGVDGGSVKLTLGDSDSWMLHRGGASEEGGRGGATMSRNGDKSSHTGSRSTGG